MPQFKFADGTGQIGPPPDCRRKLCVGQAEKSTPAPFRRRPSPGPGISRHTRAAGRLDWPCGAARQCGNSTLDCVNRTPATRGAKGGSALRADAWGAENCAPAPPGQVRSGRFGGPVIETVPTGGYPGLSLHDSPSLCVRPSESVRAHQRAGRGGRDWAERLEVARSDSEAVRPAALCPVSEPDPELELEESVQPHRPVLACRHPWPGLPRERLLPVARPRHPAPRTQPRPRGLSGTEAGGQEPAGRTRRSRGLRSEPADFAAAHRRPGAEQARGPCRRSSSTEGASAERRESPAGVRLRSVGWPAAASTRIRLGFQAGRVEW
jgi:hypothetical protein